MQLASPVHETLSRYFALHVGVQEKVPPLDEPVHMVFRVQRAGVWLLVHVDRQRPMLESHWHWVSLLQAVSWL